MASLQFQQGCSTPTRPWHARWCCLLQRDRITVNLPPMSRSQKNHACGDIKTLDYTSSLRTQFHAIAHQLLDAIPIQSQLITTKLLPALLSVTFDRASVCCSCTLRCKKDSFKRSISSSTKVICKEERSGAVIRAQPSH